MNLHKIFQIGIALTLGVCLASSPVYGLEASVPATVLSTQTESRNTQLRVISFSNAQLSSPLTQGVTTYRLVSEKSADAIQLKSCEAYHSDAKITVVKTFDKEEATQAFAVTVTWQNEKTEYRFLLPQTQGNRVSADDASLSKLEFSYGELSPKFQQGKTSYSLFLPSDVTELTLNACASSNGATVNAPKEILLNKGQEMKLDITVTAADGVTSTSYTVRLRRVKQTLAQVEELKKDPHFKGIAKKGIMENPTLYVVLGGTLAAVAIAGIFLWRRRLSLNPNPNASHMKNGEN